MTPPKSSQWQAAIRIAVNFVNNDNEEIQL